MVLALQGHPTLRKVGSEAFLELTDISPPGEKLLEYEKAIMSIKGVKSFHHLRARKVAGRVSIDMHLQLDPEMTLEKSHALGHRVKARLMELFEEIVEVLVHVEPHGRKSREHPKFGS